MMYIIIFNVKWVKKLSKANDSLFLLILPLSAKNQCRQSQKDSMYRNSILLLEITVLVVGEVAAGYKCLQLLRQ